MTWLNCALIMSGFTSVRSFAYFLLSRKHPHWMSLELILNKSWVIIINLSCYLRNWLLLCKHEMSRERSYWLDSSSTVRWPQLLMAFVWNGKVSSSTSRKAKILTRSASSVFRVQIRSSDFGNLDSEITTHGDWKKVVLFGDIYFIVILLIYHSLKKKPSRFISNK